MDIAQDINSPNFSETIDTVKQGLRPVRDFFPAYLIDQVGKQISRSILRGEKVIRLQLKPPELGVLKVEMDIKGNILKLGMIAENSSIKELLLSNVHELREALVEQGVKLDRLDIQINYNSGQSLANSKEGQGKELDGGTFVAEDDKEDPIPGARNMATGDHLLDLVA
jgi:flagellar hook-length control protein FliK